jgi:hypothetical protein
MAQVSESPKRVSVSSSGLEVLGVACVTELL